MYKYFYYIFLEAQVFSYRDSDPSHDMLPAGYGSNGKGLPYEWDISTPSGENVDLKPQSFFRLGLEMSFFPS